LAWSDPIALCSIIYNPKKDSDPLNRSYCEAIKNYKDLHNFQREEKRLARY